GAGVDVGRADLAHHVGPRQIEQVVVALLVLVEVAAAAKAFFVETIGLDHRAVGPVLDQDAVGGDVAQQLGFFGAGHDRLPWGLPWARTPSRWQMAKVRSARFSV